MHQMSCFIMNNNQYHIVFTLCYLQLDLLSNNDIIKFNDWLMSLGFYDDLMLNIVFDDLNYHESKETLLLICQKLDFPSLQICDLSLIFTMCYIKSWLQLPITWDKLNIPCFYDNFQEDIKADIIELGYLMELFDTIEVDDNHKKEIIAKFFEICQDWLHKHQNTLSQILMPFSQISKTS